MITLEFLKGIKDELIPGAEIEMNVRQQKRNGKYFSKNEKGCFREITSENGENYIKYYGIRKDPSDFALITRNIKDVECLTISKK